MLTHLGGSTLNVRASKVETPSLFAVLTECRQEAASWTQSIYDNRRRRKREVGRQSNTPDARM